VRQLLSDVATGPIARIKDLPQRATVGVRGTLHFHTASKLRKVGRDFGKATDCRPLKPRETDPGRFLSHCPQP
jgi:hypothetical protein